MDLQCKLHQQIYKRYEVDGALFYEEEESKQDFGEMVEIRDEPTKTGHVQSLSQKEVFSMPANDAL